MWLTVLLHDVRQLVGDQPLPRMGFRSKPTCTEYQIMANGVSLGVHVFRGLLGLRSGMYSNLREIVAETPSHIVLQSRSQRSARAGEDAVHARGCGLRVWIKLPVEALDARWRRTDPGVCWSG